MLATMAAAFVVSVAATPLVRRAAHRFGLLDRPNARSSHAVVTPRSGGLAILAGLAAGLAVSEASRPAGTGVCAWLAGVTIVTALGLADDRFGLAPWPRLAGQILAAAVFVAASGGLARLPLPAPLDPALGAAGAVLAVLWIVAVVNFYNFMDGIDGLAALQAVVTAGGLAWAFAEAPWAAALAAALAASALGFLVFNWAPASVFLGDGGSSLVGYTLATLPLLTAADRRPEAVALAGTSLFLFLADASLCLLRRMACGERWYEAHREHFYQRWVRSGASHAFVASLLGAASAALTALALLGWRSQEPVWSGVALLAGLAMVSAEGCLVRRLEGTARRTKGTATP
jgi:UDP-N-acetylmuramyl pentapeptide phosphotransferase/UDP-N-acetylglucosamine-1-phosphate transferase